METCDSKRPSGQVSRRRLIWQLGACAAALAALIGCGLAVAATEGKPAPSIRAKLLDGTSFKLSEKPGQVVVVHMWATWCLPCREEMPVLDAYYRQHREQGLVLIALSMDEAKDASRVRELTKAYSFPIGLAQDAEMSGYGRIWQLPLTFVIDRGGILRKDQWHGDPGLNAQSLEQTLTPLLTGP